VSRTGRLTVVAVGDFGWEIARGLLYADAAIEAIAVLVEPPADWAALPWTVVRDAAEARQLGSRIADFVMGSELVVVVGDALDPLYADMLPWVAGVAHDFQAATLEVVRADVDDRGEGDPAVGLCVAVRDENGAFLAIDRLLTLTQGESPRIGFDHRGFADLGTGVRARCADAHGGDHAPVQYERDVAELARRVGRELRGAPADAYLVAFGYFPHATPEDLERAARLIAPDGVPVHLALLQPSHGYYVLAFAFERGVGGMVPR